MWDPDPEAILLSVDSCASQVIQRCNIDHVRLLNRLTFKTCTLVICSLPSDDFSTPPLLAALLSFLVLLLESLGCFREPEGPS